MSNINSFLAGFQRFRERYIEALPTEGPLRDVIADSLDAGWITYFEPYESVHAHNVAVTLDFERGRRPTVQE